MYIRKVTAILGSVFLVLPGCGSVAQLQQVEQKVITYETYVRNACILGESLVGGAAIAIPAVGNAAILIKSGCDTEEAIQTLIASPTAFAWLNTLITTIKSDGVIVPPAPVAHA